MKKKGIIKGTHKAGENAIVIVENDGSVVVTWDSDLEVKFVSEEAFEPWVGGGKWAGKNTYIDEVIWD